MFETKPNAINSLLAYFGSANELAKALNVSPTAVHYWVVNKYIPHKRAGQIEALTKGEIKVRDLINLPD